MKKGLSVLLGLLMMLSIFTKIPFRVAAKDVDIAETGNPYPTTQDFDGDGHYEIPCTWFAWQQAYDKLGISLNMWGNGNQWFGNAKSQGKYQTGSTPKANSIACWDAGTWGHVSYVTSASGDSFTVNEGGRIDKDTTSTHGVAYDVNFNMTVGQYRDSGLKLQGFIYLDGAPTPKPSNPWINISKTTVPTGGDVSFTFGANDAAGYTIGINKNGSRIITEDVSSGKSYTFNEVGNYTAYVTAWNSAGGVDTNTVSFTVFETINLGNDFVAHITNSKSGMNIGANSVGNVELQTKDDSDNQKWHFLRQSDNSYKIINIGHNQCLDVANFGTANGTNIGLCPSNDTNAQRYYIRDNSSGYGIVPKVNTGAALDISGGALTNGANIQEYTWNGSNAQVFSIDYVGLEPSVTKEYNGHTYEYYNLTMPWNQAYRFCESKGGHLVTISTESENDLVHSMIDNITWLGGTSINNNKKWYWVTGEPFDDTVWNTNQPDYCDGIEFYLSMYYDSGAPKKWNDLPKNYPIPFVCEYDNGDVKADSYTPTAEVSIDGYTFSVYDYTVDWQTAEAICEAKGGQLAKIDSAAKNDIIKQVITKGGKSEYWINATDRLSEGTWTDSEGNPLSYFNWVDGNPDNDFNAEQYVMIGKDNGKWGDLKGFSPMYRGTGFICESEDSVRPQPSEDGWVYCSILPSYVNSDDYTIQYDNYYENQQKDSPGEGWIKAETIKNEWVNTGSQYTRSEELATSDARVLVGVSYYHHCGGSAPAGYANYEEDKANGYVHSDWVSNDMIGSRKYLGNDNGHWYYALYDKSGNTIWCQSGVTCDGSFGSHGKRSSVWYATFTYQDRAKVEIYKYTKDSGWVDSADNTAVSTKIRYKSNYVNIEFDTNGHGTAPESQNVKYGESAVKPDNPTATGYIFGGWYTDSSCTKAYDFSAAVTENLILYAKWTLRSYKITFDANGHGTAPDTQTIKYGQKVTKPTDLKETGYTFEGWFTDADCTKAYDFSKSVTKNLTLHAKWTQNTYMITFDSNGHVASPESQNVKYGEAAVKPDNPTATGYVFGGWYTDFGCTKAYDFSTAVNDNLTLYAKWTLRSYKIIFDSNGHGTAPAAQTVKYGQKVTKPTDLKETGYTFEGWFTDANCTKAYDFSKSVTKNLTLYAKWIESYILGDANGDGDVDSVDATIIQRVCTLIKVPYSEEQLMCGDVDGDGSLTIVDATFIQRYSTRVKTPYNIGEIKQ